MLYTVVYELIDHMHWEIENNDSLLGCSIQLWWLLTAFRTPHTALKFSHLPHSDRPPFLTSDPLFSFSLGRWLFLLSELLLLRLPTLITISTRRSRLVIHFFLNFSVATSFVPEHWLTPPLYHPPHYTSLSLAHNVSRCRQRAQWANQRC